MDITSAFDTISYFLRDLISWLMSHGVTFYGVFYSFFNIDIALLVASIVLSSLPIWAGGNDYE